MRQSIKHLRGVTGIYQINGPNDCRYIGSATDIRWRWCQHRWHLSRNRHPNSHLQRAWNKYGAEAFTIEVLETTSRDELIAAEQRHLDAAFAAYPERLYNQLRTAGSTIGFPASEERKRKISEANRGRIFTDEHRRRLSEAHRGQRPPEETMRKVRQSLIGRPVSEETRRKIGAANRGKKRTPEQRQVLSNNQRGRKHSDETRARMSATHLQRPIEERVRQADEQAMKRTGGRVYVLIAPDGTRHSFVNIKRFAREHGLTDQNVHSLLRGKVRHHKQWTLPPPENPDDA